MRSAGLALLLFAHACGGDTSTAPSATTTKAWGSAVQVWAGDVRVTQDTSDLQAAFDGQGTATAAWIAEDANGPRLWVARFSAGTWGQPQTLDPLAAGRVRSFALAVAQNGTAAVAWLQEADEPFLGTVWARHYSGGSWGPAEAIDGGAGEASGWPAIAAYPNGEVVAVWSRSSQRGGDLMTNRASAGGEWSGPSVLALSRDRLGIELPKVATSPRGEAFAIWAQGYVGTPRFRYQTWASRFSPATGWVAGTPLGGQPWFVSGLEVVADSSGNATVLWDEATAVPLASYASRYEAGRGWTQAQVIQAGGGAMGLEQVANGDVVTLIGQSGQFYFRRFVPGVGWGAPSVGFPVGQTYGLDFALDATGPAFMVWSQATGQGASQTFSILSNRFPDGLGWTAVNTLVGPADSGVLVYKPCIATDGQGRALALWVRGQDRVASVWSNYYTSR